MQVPVPALVADEPRRRGVLGRAASLSPRCGRVAIGRRRARRAARRQTSTSSPDLGRGRARTSCSPNDSSTAAMRRAPDRRRRPRSTEWHRIAPGVDRRVVTSSSIEHVTASVRRHGVAGPARQRGPRRWRSCCSPSTAPARRPQAGVARRRVDVPAARRPVRCSAPCSTGRRTRGGCCASPAASTGAGRARRSPSTVGPRAVRRARCVGAAGDGVHRAAAERRRQRHRRPRSVVDPRVRVGLARLQRRRARRAGGRHRRRHRSPRRRGRWPCSGPACAATAVTSLGLTVADDARATGARPTGARLAAAVRLIATDPPLRAATVVDDARVRRPRRAVVRRSSPATAGARPAGRRRRDRC